MYLSVAMALHQVLVRFANHTTMHGVPKAIHARSLITRIFWALVCLTAGVMFTMQMSEVLHRYFSYPKKVTVEVVPTSVPFPAISMCNMRNLDFHVLNTLNRKFIENHLPTAHINTTSNPFIREYMRTVAKYGELWYTYQEEHGNVFQEVFSRTTFSSNIDKEIISLAAVQLEEFVVNCHFGGNACNITRDFKQFFDPYYFNCFTYTSPQSLKTENPWSLSEGIENGWSSILFSGSGMLDKNEEIRILPGLHESSSPVSASEGVRVVIHPPDTEPFPFTEGYDVPPAFSASFGIKPRKDIRIGPPHGNCADMNRFAPDDTDRYRGISCQKMCLQSHVIRECNCEDVSLPKVPGMHAKSCRNVDSLPDSCMVEATKYCLDKLLELYNHTLCARKTRDMVTQNASLMEDCRCFPPCKEVTYDVSYSLSKWPASGYEGDAAYMDVFYIQNFTQRFKDEEKFQEVSHYFNDSLRDQTMRDFARLNVYVADSNVIKTTESPDYNTNQLVSDIGGQLGLWVGISVITLTEVLELFCDIARYLLSGNVGSDGNKSKLRRRTIQKNDSLNNDITRHGPEYETMYKKPTPSTYNNDKDYAMTYVPAQQINGLKLLNGK